MEKIFCTNCSAANLANAKYCSNCGHGLPKPAEHGAASQLPQAVNKPLPGNKKNIAGALVGVAIFWIMVYAVYQAFFKAPSFDKVMISMASELNKTCPIMVDKYTRLDNAVALPGNSFQYNYTIIYTQKLDVDAAVVKKNVELGIISNLKTSTSIKAFREHNTTLIYNFQDQNGTFTFNFSVTPDMYK